MTEHFGSDNTFRRLKGFAAAGDRDSLAAELLEHVKKTCAGILMEMGIRNLSADDREDFESAAFMQIWKYIDRFLGDPRNDPDDIVQTKHFLPAQRTTWLKNLIRHAMITELQNNIIGNRGYTAEHDVYHDAFPQDAAEEEASDDSKKEYLRFVPLENVSESDLASDSAPSPEAALLRSTELAEAMDQLFSLKNKAETLTVVSYVLIMECLQPDETREGYAARLKGASLQELRDQMGTVLRLHKIDANRILRGLDTLLQKAGGETVISGITPDKINNRKSSVLKLLRKND